MKKNMKINCCPSCQTPDPDKGRAFDGRRAYRCVNCRKEWTNGMQGRKRRYSTQRTHLQFKDSGAERFEHDIIESIEIKK